MCTAVTRPLSSHWWAALVNRDTGKDTLRYRSKSPTETIGEIQFQYLASSFDFGKVGFYSILGCSIIFSTDYYN